MTIYGSKPKGFRAHVRLRISLFKRELSILKKKLLHLRCWFIGHEYRQESAFNLMFRRFTYERCRRCQGIKGARSW